MFFLYKYKLQIQMNKATAVIKTYLQSFVRCWCYILTHLIHFVLSMYSRKLRLKRSFAFRKVNYNIKIFKKNTI